VLAAKALGLRYLGFTEHIAVINGLPSEMFFHNLSWIPQIMEGVIVLRGIEANVADFSGAIDVPKAIEHRLDWVIASMHDFLLAPGTKEEHTRAWLGVAENPLVDVIGHCGMPAFDFDHRPVVKACAEYGKIIEINANSDNVRPGSRPNCKAIANLCAEYGVPVLVNSDAHHLTCIGNFDNGISLLEEIGFPKELVLNASVERFDAFLKAKGIFPEGA
jgi:putative hydrolase